MEVDLSPKEPRKSYGGDGGSYYTWKSSDLPMLSQAKVGGAKLVLEPRGLALPSYCDSAKVVYVLEGSGRAGIVLPEATKEKVVQLTKGDALALPFGVVTWWFNDSNSNLVILFLGDTSKAHLDGEFTNFPLTGASSIFHGFSTEFVGRAWDLKEDEVKKVVTTQTGKCIIKLKEGASLPAPSTEDAKGMVFNCESAPLDVDIEKGGRVVVLTPSYLSMVAEVGLGADLVKLDPHAMCSPGFSSDSAFQVTYVVRGSGRVQVVGVDGKRVLETRVTGGCMFIVPRFFVVSKIADAEGLEWFSIITTPEPVFSHLAGRTSVWKALSSEVLEAAFDISGEMEKLFRSKRTKDAIFFPPPN